MLRTAAVAGAGFFDEQFFLFYEDGDLSRRLADAGWALAVCPAARLTHFGHQTVLRPELAIFTPMQGLHSRYLYFAKYEGRPRALVIAWVGRGLMGARGVRLIASGLRRHRPDRLRQGRLLVTLAGYDPRRPPSLPPRPAPVDAADSGVRPAGASRMRPGWWSG
jgi:GT2 family glycosyltransferase